MAMLLDTSILVRFANSDDVQHRLALKAVLEFHRRGEVLHTSPQVMIEFRNVATRATSMNGAGLEIAAAESHAAVFEERFPLLVDTPEIFPAWKALVKTLGVIGKQVHDARLVAVCQVHKVDQILTFNVGHFTRLAGQVPGLAVVDPATV